jgi:biotin transport system ATP-binding protein
MIETIALQHSYDETTVIDGISLTIDDGEWVVIIGANGSGKTTLVRHFNGLCTPDSGSVIINGTPVSANLLAARTAVGMVFQTPRDQFVAATVEADVAFGPENLGLSHADIETRVNDALATVGLSECRHARTSELSGGERARVAIAGVLAMRPDHIVLDEPFAGLDLSARASIQNRLRTLAANGTGLITVTHDLEAVINDVDRIIVIQEGQIAYEGSPTSACQWLSTHSVDIVSPSILS